ncbi:hypothetical protein BZA70DRAFT_275137 [Myxozyma melibiosi]|uniref:Uncharacterized protein n=1 Tax=Myxozyma melibiosi TaxID=54550 RepID=A0ABR1FCD9_9ASCO
MWKNRAHTKRFGACLVSVKRARVRSKHGGVRALRWDKYPLLPPFLASFPFLPVVYPSFLCVSVHVAWIFLLRSSLLLSIRPTMRQCRLCDVDLTDGYASDYCADCRSIFPLHSSSSSFSHLLLSLCFLFSSFQNTYSYLPLPHPPADFNKYNRKLLLEHMRQRELEAEGRFESESEARATELRVARASRLSRIAASRGEQDKKADEKDKKGKGYK